MTFIRLGGRAVSADGGSLVWSLAQGRRGSRWREQETPGRDGSGTARALLAEESPLGRIARLEVSDRSGLLTLHPSADGSELHGNVVTPDGMRHLAFEWTDDDVLIVDGSPATLAIAIHRHASLAVGATVDVVGLLVGDGLGVAEGRWSIERLADDGWRLSELGGRAEDGPPERLLRLDAAGVPRHPAGDTWPLER